MEELAMMGEGLESTCTKQANWLGDTDDTFLFLFLDFELL